MKHVALTLSLIILISLSSPVVGQEKQQTIEKKVMIIKKSDNDDKNVWISDDGKRIDVESNDMLFIGSDAVETDKDISVNVSKSIKDGVEIREIEITITEDGNSRVIAWEDDGVTIPDDIQELLDQEGVDVYMFSGDEDIKITVDASAKSDDQQDKSILVDIDTNDENGEIRRDVDITIEENGEKQVMKWSDNGETPADIQEKLDELGIDLNMAEGGSHHEDVEVIIEKILEEDIDVDEKDIEKRMYKIELSEDEDVSDDIRQELEKLGIDIDALIQEAKDKKTGDEPVKMKKRIRINSEGDDLEGDTDVRVIRLKDGEELPEDIKQLLDKEGINLDELHEGHMKGSHSGKTKHKIKIKDNNGSMKVMTWDVEGEMPAEMKEHLKIIKKEGHGSHFKTNHTKSNKAQLGVMIEDHDKGILVSEVIEGSAASRIGMSSGDVITHVDGLQVFDVESLLAALKGKVPNDKAHFTFLRDDVPYNATTYLQSQSNASKNIEKTVKVIIEKCDTKNMTGDEDVDFLFQPVGEQKDEAELKLLEATDKRVDSATIAVNPKPTTEVRELPAIDKTNQLQLTDFKAFPNPTSGFVNISFEAMAEPVVVQLIDITGKTIFKETLNSFNGNFNKDIDLSDAQKGQLILYVTQDQKMFVESIIVQ